MLQPLEVAVSKSPLVLALKRPTLINGEMLFLPHIRCATKLQQILTQAKQVLALLSVPFLRRTRGENAVDTLLAVLASWPHCCS